MPLRKVQTHTLQRHNLRSFGVEVTQKSVRRERHGHISLAVPVVHIWYFRSVPSKIGTILGIAGKELEKIIYYESYVVVNPGPTGLQIADLISEDQYIEILSSLPEENQDLDDDNPKKFIAKMGGDAVEEPVRRVNVDNLAAEFGAQLVDGNISAEENRMNINVRVF